MSPLEALTKSRMFKFGLPFFVIMIGGSFGLKEFSQLRYDFKQVTVISNEEAEKLSKVKTAHVTLESEYEKIKQINIDNWENKRGPRPWEQPENQSNK